MLDKFREHFEEYLLIGSYFVLVPLLFLQIVMRYVFSNSLTWSEELARYIFLWQLWLGAGWAVKKERHIRIEIIKGKLSEKGGVFLEIFVTVVWCAFTIFLITKSYEITAKIWKLKQFSPALHLPMAIPYSSVPVGCMLMLTHLVGKLYALIKRLGAMRKGEKA